MSFEKPNFELKSVYDNGDESEAELVPVIKVTKDVAMSRRGFLTSSLILGAGVSASVLSKENSAKKATNELSAKRDSKSSCSKEIIAHKKQVTHVVFSFDGKLIATVSKLGGSVKIWSFPELKLIRTIKVHLPVSAKFLWGNKHITILSSSPNIFKTVSIQAGVFSSTVKLSSKKIVGHAYNREVDLLAIAFRDKSTTLDIINVQKGNSIRQQKITLSNGALSLTFSNKGDRLYIADPSYKHISMGPEEWKFRHAFRTKLEDITNIQISHDDKWLVMRSEYESSYKFRSIQIYGLETNGLRYVKKSASVNYLGFRMSSASEYFAAYSSDFIDFWKSSDGKAYPSIPSIKNNSKIDDVIFSPDDQWLLIVSKKAVHVYSMQDKKFVTCLYDPKANSKKQKAIQFTHTSSTGHTVTYTLPCGSPIPPGAVCTCNCVPGTYSAPIRRSTPSYNRYCTCNKICTCIPVCHAHRLLSSDFKIQLLAEQLLLLMGKKQLKYLHWAKLKVQGGLKRCIENLIIKIKQGKVADKAKWLSIEDCVHYMSHDDEVTTIMAAQMLEVMIGCEHNKNQIGEETFSTMKQLTSSAIDKPWYNRY